MTSLKVGNERLEQAAKLVEKTRTFDQSCFITFDEDDRPVSSGKNCKTPACVLGHYAVANPKRWRIDEDADYAPRLRRNSTGSAFGDAAIEFGITQSQAELLFDGDGCGDAGYDGKKAAAFIRTFIAVRSFIAKYDYFPGIDNY